MSSLLEIESAIRQLPPTDLLKLTAWIETLTRDGWEAQMDSDAAAGRLDFLFDEAESARDEGKNRAWPPHS